MSSAIKESLTSVNLNPSTLFQENLALWISSSVVSHSITPNHRKLRTSSWGLFDRGDNLINMISTVFNFERKLVLLDYLVFGIKSGKRTIF